ncbi:SRPBCC family protein, partial [Arthrobacter deserti]|nr:SRPBCC family protein [Arthrobacter deserti]
MRNGPSEFAGRGLAQVFRALKTVRPVRPIHPHGVGLAGTLERHQCPVPSGIAWIGTPGTDAVQARLSRSAGLPPVFPDILGLALRVPAGSGHFDVLLSSTGMSRPGRFLLTARKTASAAAFTTVMPYRGAQGPVLLAARTVAAVPAL